MPSLIADPDLPYSELAARLRALGWEWRSESQEMPTIPGEPESVIWALEAPDTTLSYSFNPVISFRVLAFSGEGAERQYGRVASFVPHLSDADIASLLLSGDTEPVLLGLFATRELGLSAMQPLVLLLTVSDDDLVAQIAGQVAGQIAEALPPPQLEKLKQTLFGPQAGETGRQLSGLSSVLEPSIRRQLIRRAARDLENNQSIALEFLLGTGLADPDWEVRASAMLIAGRHAMTAMHDAIATLELPSDARWGHSEQDLQRLELLRTVVLGHLAGEPPPDGGDARHALDCILEHPRGRFDGLFLLVHALTTPTESGPKPETLPPFIVDSDEGYVLARSRIPMAWVAPVPCWLGDPDGGGEVANPLRRVVPSVGYFIARRPLSRAAVNWLKAGGKGPSRVADARHDADYLCSSQEGAQIIETLAAIERARIGLPSADQWEIATRGPDGRRYPWGNGIEDDPEPGFSPWGLARMVGKHPHWTRTVGGESVACGGPDLRCDRRRLDQGDGLLRPIC